MSFLLIHTNIKVACVCVYRSPGVGSKRTMNGIHHPDSANRAKSQKRSAAIDPDALSLCDDSVVDDDDDGGDEEKEEKEEKQKGGSKYVTLQRLLELITLADRYCIEDRVFYAQCWSGVLQLTTVHNILGVWKFANTMHELHPQDCNMGALWSSIVCGLLRYCHTVLRCDAVTMAIVKEAQPDQVSAWAELADAVSTTCL
jgi:hypothetical protein